MDSLLERQGCSIEDGQLIIEQVPAARLKDALGTPLYVYSQSTLEQNMRRFKQAFRSRLFQTEVVYASKAFSCLEMLKLVQKEGLYLDTVSLQEMKMAKKAGFDMSHVVLHGNNKSLAELEYAFENGAGTIVCDNPMEAALLAGTARKYPDHSIDVLIRINPGIECHTHEYIQTATVDAKFGIYYQEDEEIMECVRFIESQDNLHFKGFHFHIGSQIFELKAYEDACLKMALFSKRFTETTGLNVDILDAGGGFAAQYVRGQEPPEIEAACHSLIRAMKFAVAQTGIDLKSFWIEPGRSITANAGLTLYTVDQIKKTPNKLWYFADGGMNDNIRPALYQAEYECDLANRMDEEKTETVTVAGKCCESGDILVPETFLPMAKPGDLLAVYATGAYGYSMASHYNKLPVPPVVFVSKDQARVVVRPETEEDLFARESNTKVEL